MADELVSGTDSTARWRSYDSLRPHFHEHPPTIRLSDERRFSAKAEKQTGAIGMQRTDCSANTRDILAVVVTRWFNAAICTRVRS
jgi:hypothetical protein